MHDRMASNHTYLREEAAEALSLSASADFINGSASSARRAIRPRLDLALAGAGAQGCEAYTIETL